MNCIQKVQSTIEAHALIDSGSRVLAAVSGGPDSTALLSILGRLSSELRFELAAAHFDHRIRAESERERVAVERFASSLGIQVFLGSKDVPRKARMGRLGLEEAARNERYRFLEKTAKEYGAGAVALGHTRDDQVETVLHRILRGTGWRGLIGMQPRRGIFIRPLLDCGRRELIMYLRSRRISYVIDSSNKDNRFYRNRIRNRLLPYLRKDFNPAVDEALLRLRAGALEGWHLLEAPISARIPKLRRDGTVIIPLRELEGSSDFEIYLMIDLILRERFGIFQDIERTHFDAAKRLIRSAQSGRRLRFPHDVILLKEQRNLAVMVERAESSATGMIVVPGPGRYELPQWNLSLEVETVTGSGIEHRWSDLEVFLAKVRFPIRARSRREGDRVAPFGMRGRKKLSDLYIDRKTPLRMRDRYPVFEDADGILWVPGLVTDERTRITGRTRRAVRLEVSESVKKQ
jgi:tRNA(Ile)-lysidine synthase